MIYKNTNGNDDFKVEYTLVVPEENTGYQLSAEEEKFLAELDDVYADIERFTNQADGYDYALAVSSGIITGLIDVFGVGEWNFKTAKENANKEINNKIVDFAKKDPRYLPWCNGVDKDKKWIKRDPSNPVSAVEFLEEKYKLPGDNDWKFKGSTVTAKTHHLDDFCHHPTLIGMICCILVQFTGNAKYHSATGENYLLPVTVNEYGNFVSGNRYGKVFAGIVNWFFTAWKTIENREGHLMSDMAGSIQAKKAGKEGAGIPGTVISTLKELSALPCLKDTDFAENLRKAYQNGIGNTGSKLDLGIFNFLFEGADSNKVDIRTETAVKHELKRQSVPVIINEVIVRAFYFVRRFIEQVKNKESFVDIDWKKLLPANNRTIARMITISSGTFVLVDQADAIVHGAKEASQNGVDPTVAAAAFAKGYILRVNFVGIGRFAIAVGTDLYMGARKERLELAAASGETAKTAITIKQKMVEISDNHVEVNRKLNEINMGIEVSGHYKEDYGPMEELIMDDITTEELMVAASEIFSATEKDFTKIKSEKWYQTIFNNLSFSQNGQKYVIKDIKSLAKLQQLFLEIITRIDKATQQQMVAIIDEVISNRHEIAQTQNELKQLKGMYGLFLDRIKGIEEQQGLESLNEDDAKILVLLLMEYKNDENSVPDEVKKYNRGIMSALKVSSPIGVISAEMITDLRAPKIIYRCFLEQCAVAGTIHNKEWMDNVEIIKYFDIGMAQKEKIEKSVKTELEAFGIEYFYEKYVDKTEFLRDDGFVFALDEQTESFVVETEEMLSERILTERDEFDDTELCKLQEIAYKHGLIKDKEGFRELTEEFFYIPYEAYLGRNTNLAVYFTTVCAYGKKVDGEWVYIGYEEMDVDNISHRKDIGSGKEILDIFDEEREKVFSYTGGQNECDDFIELLYELKEAVTPEQDEYTPFWFEDNYEYGEILIDFLKWSNNKVEDYMKLSVLKKCGEIIGDEDDENYMGLKQMCQYALLPQEVTEDMLYKKISKWKSTFDASFINVHMALLIKDFVEILQLSKAEEYIITERERRFLKKLAEEAQIEDFDKFMDMVRLPYCLISENGSQYFDILKIVETEAYTYEQMHIPFQILDNEKNGLWSTVHKLSTEFSRREREKNKFGAKFKSYMNRDYLINNDYLIKPKDMVETLLEQAMWVAYSDFCVGMSLFIMKISSHDEEIITTEHIGNFLANCGLSDCFLEVVVDNVYDCLDDEEWNNVLDKYNGGDKRTLGNEMVDTFFRKKQ